MHRGRVHAAAFAACRAAAGVGARRAAVGARCDASVGGSTTGVDRRAGADVRVAGLAVFTAEDLSRLVTPLL